MSDAAVRRPRLLIFIVAYHAESTIEQVLAQIPATLATDYDVEVLIIDDSSADATFERGVEAGRLGTVPFPTRVLYNPVNLGYGGNQKVGYHYAIEYQFDFVALVHGDGQYAPECLPALLAPLGAGECDAVFGSRMLEAGNALRGGMPLYKYLGNKILTAIENRALRTSLSEFHSGYRVYAVAALRDLPFALNSDDFHFDTEIIVQCVVAGKRIRELPIPTYYGDEICYVNGLAYAWNVLKSVAVARAQELSLFYTPKFDCAPDRQDNQHYQVKEDFDSPHTRALADVAPGSKVLDLGCAGGYVGDLLRKTKGCHVTGVDCFPLADGVVLDRFFLCDLNTAELPVEIGDFDYVLLLDVIEHLNAPEAFVARLRDGLALNPNTTLIVSTGNVGFAVVRLMLALGQFNYGKRGILDLTHTRLFTFSSIRRLFEQYGFLVDGESGLPAPFPLATGRSRLATVLLRLNQWLIGLSKGLFAYQIYLRARARPTLPLLLKLAHAAAATKEQAMEARRAVTG